MKYRYRQARNAIVDNRTLWEEGLSEEVEFWTSVFHDPDSPHYRHPVHLADINRPLNSELRTILGDPAPQSLRILDLGAGPVTQLGYQWSDHDIEIVPVDPLADVYNRLLSEVGCTPPFPARLMHAEEISEHFEPESFDVIYSRNALDHSYDPMSALRQARTLLKPGGLILLQHMRNEGRRIYGGLHQWNFDVQQDDFIIWNMKQRYIVKDELAPVQVNVKLVKDEAINKEIVGTQIWKPAE